MATLYISEHPELRPTHAVAPFVEMPPLQFHTIAIGASSTQSAAFDTRTRLVTVHADAACSIAFGINPTATASDMRLAANETRHYRVNHGDKIAVITNN